MRADRRTRCGVILEEDQKLCCRADAEHARQPDHLLRAVTSCSEGNRVVFITKDINARIKSDALGCRPRISRRRRSTSIDLYTGCREVSVGGQRDRPALQGKATSSSTIEPAAWSPTNSSCCSDETDPSHTALGRYKADGGVLVAGAQPSRAGVRHHAAQPPADDGAGSAAG